jgi:glycosyltransferase involved in cell wall biosynthesis
MNLDNLTAVITHYNTPEWLITRAVESIEKHGIDYIIVNDCSAPQFTGFLDKFGNSVLHLCERRGQSGAMYAGMYAASTPYVMRFGSDDILIGLPDEYEDVDVVMPKNKYPIPTTPEELRRSPYTYLNGAIFRVATTLRLWGENRDMLHDDIEFMYRMFSAKLKTKHSSKKWYEYTSDRKDSVTKTTSLIEKKACQERLYEKLGRP